MGAIETITAAATRILSRGKGGGGGGGTTTPGQSLAWDMYEQVPEVGTYADWVANAMSGTFLFAGFRGEDGTIQEAPANSRASELVASIAGGPDGQAELLGSLGTGLAVAGEAWVIIIPDPESDTFADDQWLVLSTEEVTHQRGKIKANIDGDVAEIPEYDPDNPPGPEEPVAIRVWKPSPRKHFQATSPVLRSLTVLEELRLLNAAVSAVARSRITGRGVLLVPSGTRFPSADGQQQAPDSLLDTFIEVASTAIREPESAAATVPILLEVPGDFISGVKWLQFDSEFDAMAMQLRDEAIRRFATGADVPAEVLLGLGDTNHWGAWALTAEALKMGAEPRLALVCNALTTEWLRPLLEVDGEADPGQWMVWYDTSALRSSSNKGANALEAFKEGLISDDAARRELGFTGADAPNAGAPVSRTTERNTLPVSSTEAPPSEMDLAASTPVADPLAPALVAAVDGIVHTALVTAGLKIMRTPLCPRPHRAAARTLAASGQVHTRYPATAGDVDGYHLLDHAWVRVPEVAARYGVDDADLTEALEEYAVALITTGQPHTYEDVTRMLARKGILPSTAIGMVKP